MEIPESAITTPPSCVAPFQEDEMNVHLIEIEVDEEPSPLNDPNGYLVEIDDVEVEDEDDIPNESQSESESELESDDTFIEEYQYDENDSE